MNANVYCENDILYLAGDVNFSTVNQLWKDSVLLLANQSVFHIDLSNVTSANSAAIALLLEWLKYANQLKKSIIFNNIPKEIKSLASISGVKDFF